MLGINSEKQKMYLKSMKFRLNIKVLIAFYIILRLIYLLYNQVGGERSNFLPTFVFRPLPPSRMRFRTWRFFI